MKRSKLMAGIIAASIALLGTGYAYWSDALTVTTSVSTGELKVQYTTAGFAQGELNETYTAAIPEIPEIPGTPGQDAVMGESARIQVTKRSQIPNNAFNSGKEGYWYTKWVGGHNGYESEPTYVENWYQIDVHSYKTGDAYWYTVLEEITPAIPGTPGTPGTPGKDAQYGEAIATDATAKGALGAAGYIKEGTAVVNADKDNVAITIKNMYPGSFATATFTATNAGTIPVVLDTVTLDSTVGALGAELKVIALTSGQTLDDEKIAAASNFADIASVIKTVYGDAKLEPESAATEAAPQSVTMTLVFIMPGSVTEHQNVTNETVNLTLNWGQHNQLRTSEKAPATATE